MALDTTTRAGSVALVSVVGGDRIVDERPGDGSRTHAERLPAEILELLAGHDRTLADVDVFAVASGPGSFTGLRIGIATIQGLALVSGRPVVAVSALDAIASVAARGSAPGERIGAWMDAHRGEVFTAFYELSAEDEKPDTAIERLKVVEAPAVAAPEATLDRWSKASELPAIFAGDGAVLYHEAIERVRGDARIVPTPCLAGAIGLIAAARARRGESGHAAAVQPLYIRRPDAELAREHALAHRSAEHSRRD